jgi:uroporphyrinogen-III decarboxylase
MNTMSPVERVLRTFEGKPVDRVPSFCAMMEGRTVGEILGKPLVSKEKIMNLPVTRFLFDRWGSKLTKLLARPNLVNIIDRRIMGQIEMGFDAIWAYYDDTWIFYDSKTIALTTGSFYDIIPDGYGNITYMYRSPGIKTPEEFDAWPFWPDPDDVAHRVYTYFKKLMARYGEKTCIFGYGFFGGLYETLNWTFGISRTPVWIRKHPQYVERFLDRLEELSIKSHNALMDAGVPVILQTDDFAHKTGPFMNPKAVEDIFGERYRRIIKNVHDRGFKYVLHSCGDNTKLFDLFIKWGVDGLHAYENTSNVDIYHEKKIHGDQATIIGGVGIDYLLTDRSKDEEIVEKVKNLVRDLGPGGRFILSPVHSADSIPAHKLQVMLDAVKKYGAYSN